MDRFTKATPLISIGQCHVDEGRVEQVQRKRQRAGCERQ
jgi:hypothetical protein